MPAFMAQVVSSTFAPRDESHANTDETGADAIEGDLPAEVGRDEKHASSRDEQVAAAPRILWIRHFAPPLEDPTYEFCYARSESAGMIGRLLCHRSIAPTAASNTASAKDGMPSLSRLRCVDR